MTPQREREIAQIMAQAYRKPIEQMYSFLALQGLTDEEVKVAHLVKMGIDIGKRLPRLEVV